MLQKQKSEEPSLPSLVETSAPQSSVHIVEAVDIGNGQKRLKVRGVFQEIGSKNENNRRYPETIWDKNLAETSKLMLRIRERKVLGELEHPDSGITQLPRVSHTITKVWKDSLPEGNAYNVPEGKYILGEALIFNTPSGKILQELYSCGVPVGISSRGRGNTATDSDGVDVVQEDYEADTWDFVYQPSVQSAYPIVVPESSVANFRSEAEALLTETEDLTGKLPIELIELGYNALHASNMIDEKSSASLHARLKQRYTHIHEAYQKSKTPPSKKENRSKVMQEKAVVQSNIQHAVVEEMVRRTLIAESKGGKPDEGIVKKYNVSVALIERLIGKVKELENSDAPTMERYKQVNELAEGLLKRARAEYQEKLVLKKERDAAIELAESIRQKYLALSGGKKVEESKQGQILKETTAASKKEGKDKIHDPAGRLIERKVPETSKEDRNLITALSESTKAFNG